MGHANLTPSWWERPSLRGDPTAYRTVVRMAERRDQAAVRRRAESPDRVISPESREFFGAFAPLSVYSEDVGGFAAEALLSVGLPADLRARLVRAMWDEIRHSDLCDALDVNVTQTDPSPVNKLLDLLDVPDTALQFAVLHTELEALALDFFHLVVAAEADSYIGDVYRTVAADEATHVALGFDAMAHLVDGGERLEPDILAHTLDCALTLSPLGNPGGLAALASTLDTSTRTLVKRLTARRDRRSARIRALLSQH